MIKLINEMYDKLAWKPDLKYEIINVAQDSTAELLDILSRTKEDYLRFDIADLIIDGAKNVYVIESVELRGALFVSTDYNKTLEEWFKLSYLKEQ